MIREMLRKRIVSLSLVALALVTLIPAAAWAQGSGIAGVVRDTTGAVLPGVTVEAASPVLIEKIRTVVTDDQGLYKIVDLRPGAYTVTFTLTGFNTVKREGVELTTNFTATVNAEMPLGSLAETVIVSGQSPLVDIQNVVQQKVISRELINTLPTSKGFTSFATLIPGMRNTAVADVGGSSGDFFVANSVHGSRSGDQRVGYDGFRSNNVHAGGGGGGYTMYMNPGSIQEVSVTLDNVSAESDVAGVKIDVIPKDGGNTFSGFLALNGTRDNLQSNNLTPDLKARGLQSVNSVKNIWDINPAFGGRIVRNKLWFFLTSRWWGNESYVAGNYFSQDPLAWTYTPDLSKQAVGQNKQRSSILRLTLQANQKNRVTFYYDNQFQLLPYGPNLAATVSPEAAVRWTLIPNYNMQAKWTGTLSNKLLFEAGIGFVNYNALFARQPGVPLDTISVTELSNNRTYRANPTYTGTSLRAGVLSHMFNERAVMTYVTGSHAFRGGMILSHGLQDYPFVANGDVTYQFLNGKPRTVVLRATPLHTVHRFFPDLGLFAQDQWTLKGLTLNMGLRFTHHNASVVATDVPAGTFVPARSYPGIDNVPNWTNLSPRLGASYDLFGNGKTAIKASIGHYLASETVAFATLLNPQNRAVNSATRTWNDVNGDYVPNCDLLNPVANDECGPLSDTNFGKPSLTSTTYDPNLLRGYGKRPDNWEASAGIQHELWPGVSVSASYFHRSYGKLWVNDNRAVAPSDYDPFCLTVPTDSRLANAGSQLCGFYDINPAKFGQVDNFVTLSDNYGKQINVYDGVDLLFNARLPNGVFIAGGLNTGRELFDNCDIVGKVDNSPTTNFGVPTTTLGLVLNNSGLASPSTNFCRVAPPFEVQLKLQGSYALPWWGLRTSATVQSVPGPMIVATYVAPNAAIAPSLHRNLAAGVNGTATVQLIQPGTLYGERLNQVDFRLTKIIRHGQFRVEPQFDLYNLFNANPVTSLNTRYGPSWQVPLAILQGRLIKFGVQVEF